MLNQSPSQTESAEPQEFETYTFEIEIHDMWMWFLIILLAFLSIAMGGMYLFQKQQWPNERAENHRLLESLRATAVKSQP